jgi:hypothetical protein
VFGVGIGKNHYFTDVPSITDIREGFWVDESFEYVKTGNNKYWIPPSRILHVEKIYG